MRKYAALKNKFKRKWTSFLRYQSSSPKSEPPSKPYSNNSPAKIFDKATEKAK
jgi:hypothetical protein